MFLAPGLFVLALAGRALTPFEIPAGPAVIRLPHPGTNDVGFAADAAPIPPEIER